MNACRAVGVVAKMLQCITFATIFCQDKPYGDNADERNDTIATGVLFTVGSREWQ
jgi:hypothetical protein